MNTPDLHRFTSLPGSRALREGLSRLSFLERSILYVLLLILAVSTATMLKTLWEEYSVIVPASGGTITEGLVGTPRFVNPLLAQSEVDKDLVALMYSGLMRPTPEGTLIPDLAEKYDVSENGTVYTFTLRDDATFHDGRPVTAHDVVFTIERAQDPFLGSVVHYIWEGITVVAADTQTVVFTLPRPYTPFLENTTLGILPSHLWQGVTAETFPAHRLNTSPIGSGPFKVDRVMRDASGIPVGYTLNRFTRFALGAPRLQSIVISTYDTEDAALEAFLDGDIDAVKGIDPVYGQDLADDVRIAEYPLTRLFGVFFNQNENELFTDITVREALAIAIDKDALVEEVLYGYGTPLSGPLLPPLVEVKAEKSGTVEKARAILEDDGWEIGDDGIFAKDDTPLSFNISTANTPELKRTAEVLKRMWETMGASVTVELFDIGALHQEVIRPRAYDALLFGQVIGRGGDLYPFWHSSQRNDPGLNIALYANIATDDILSDIRITLDAGERKDLYAAFADEIESDIPAVFLYAPEMLYLVPETLKGITAGPLDEANERFMDVYTWHMATKSILSIFKPAEK